MEDDEIILPVQRMFPNCRKYKKCCTKDNDFWGKVQDQPPVKEIIKMKKIELNMGPPPEGFEGW